MKRIPLKQVTLLIFFLGLCVVLPTFGQKRKSMNLMDYDSKKLHYGFQLGLHQSTFQVKHSDFFAQNGDSTIAIRSIPRLGFSIGFILNLRLKDDLWDLRLLPNVVFYDRNVTFDYPNTSVEQLFESTFIDFPILLKYKSLRRNNHRWYMFGGITPSLKVGSKREELLEKSLLTKDFNWQVEYGIGWDMYMAMFKLAPEIRFSHGVRNMLRPNDYTFSNNMDRMLSHKISIVLNFE